MRGWMGGLATADFPRSEPCPVALRLPGLRSCRLLQAQRPGEFPQTVPRTCRAPGLPGLRSCRPLQAQSRPANSRRWCSKPARALAYRAYGLVGCCKRSGPGEFPQAVSHTCRASGLPGLRSCRPEQAQRRPASSRRRCRAPAGLLAYRAYGLVGCCKRSAPANSRRWRRASVRALAYRVYGLVGRCKRSAARRIPAGGAAHLPGSWLTGPTVL